MTPSSPDVEAILEAPPSGAVWIDLPQGPGAGELARARLRSLLAQGVVGEQLLILLPQRDRRHLYEEVLSAVDAAPAVRPEMHTYYSLASRMVRLFWPHVAPAAGFARPLEAPVLLTYETAQYVMSQILVPYLAQGFFEGLALRPQRLLSQLLDNLNKAAVNGYEIADVGRRLASAWGGLGDGRELFLLQAQTCIERYRAHCLAHNLVDVSLVLETFRRHLNPSPVFRAYADERFRHLLVEGVEETVPVAQDFLAERMAASASAFLVARRDGGYRVFLGVDPEGAWELRDRCACVLSVPETPITPAALLGQALSACFERGRQAPDAPQPGAAARLLAARHRGEMVAAVAAEVVRLVGSGEAEAGDIAIIAPHADGVLRFLIDEALAAADIPCVIVRRFESLREAPEVRVALALAALAHPDWQRRPHASDVAEALTAALGLDPVRARLLTRAGYDASAGVLRCLGTEDRTLAERLAPETLDGYETLRRWLEARREAEPQPLDLFFRRLFGEVLSRADLDPGSASMYARLISSAAWFRRSAPALGATETSATADRAGHDADRTGVGYAQMVEEGIVAAAHSVPMSAASPTAVLVVAPVYTYLLEERTARFQFWLDVGSISWWEPPHQPLTNPHVLSRRWPTDARWTDAVDFDTRNRILGRLVRGLCSRADGAVYLCWSEAESGGEAVADSPLLRAASQVVGLPEAGA